MMASRAVRCLSFAVATLFGSAALAGAPALVVDVDSGKVLYSDSATEPWFPASVTKLMTAYVALDLVRQGRITLDQPITVSADAAAQPPSKMGFKPGTQLTLDNALKIIMVKSANDIAHAIAENLGGSVEGFATLMNDTSARLGMRESNWVNAHGLPDDRQQTSARDMAILGRAILRDFPEHRGLFQISAIQFGKRVMANHNGLMGRFPGVDGMKTGFICASGFNVVASATRNGRRLITVVFGSPNATERTFKAADLFDYGFSTMGLFGSRLEDLPPSASLAPPNMRPYICGGKGAAPGESDAPDTPTDANNSNPSSPVFASSAMAFASTAPAAPAVRRTLPPRAALQPIRVWVGLTPPSENAVASAEESEPEKPAKAKPVKAAKPKPAPKAPKAAAKDKPADKSEKATLAATPAIIDDGKGAKKPVDPAAALKAADKKAANKEQKTAADKEPAKKAATAARKPAPKPDAKPAQVAAKPDAKPDTKAKPKAKQDD